MITEGILLVNGEKWRVVLDDFDFSIIEAEEVKKE